MRVDQVVLEGLYVVAQSNVCRVYLVDLSVLMLNLVVADELAQLVYVG